MTMLVQLLLLRLHFSFGVRVAAAIVSKIDKMMAYEQINNKT